MARIGELTKRIELQNVTQTFDAYRVPVNTWTTFATVWANITPLAGMEKFNAQQKTAELSHKITIRYNSTITPKSRVKFGSRIFEISEILNEDEGNVYMQLICKEAVIV